VGDGRVFAGDKTKADGTKTGGFQALSHVLPHAYEVSCRARTWKCPIQTPLDVEWCL